MDSETLKGLEQTLPMVIARQDLDKWLAILKHLYKENREKYYPKVLELRVVLEGKIKSGENVKGNYSLLKESYLLTARDKLDDYMIYLEWERDKEKRFYLPRRKQLKPLVDALEKLHYGELDLLCISMPPGTGKTTLALFFLTWTGALRPDKPILTCSHNNSFLGGAYDEILRLLDPNGEYLFKDVFPESPVVKTNAKDMMIDLQQGRRFSTYEFTSVGAGNAGKVRANLLYCDDLVEGLEQALSRDRMEKLWNSYTVDLRQRKIGSDSKELHIATRWSVNDPIGRLQLLNEGNPRAMFIVESALDENDESRFDYPYGVGHTTESLLNLRDTMDEPSWRALYMNEPIEREGLLYFPQDLERYYELPEEEPDAICAVCDVADGGGDDLVMPIFYQYGNKHYLVDVVCSNALPEVTNKLCAEMLIKWKVQRCQFESNAMGLRAGDSVQDLIKDKCKCHITKKKTTQNKETKIIMQSEWVKSHVIFKDDKVIDKGSMYYWFMKKLCSYTQTGRNKHDDCPDAIAQYALFATTLIGGKVTVMSRPF